MALGPKHLELLTPDDLKAIKNIEESIDYQLAKNSPNYPINVFISDSLWAANLSCRGIIRLNELVRIYTEAGWKNVKVREQEDCCYITFTS